ncbi:hypothetical protein CTAYLR_004007 [Chrysophaeum taylorii]|uniref:Uncharacterized protein n=1 Tax=Chrysophaeum taylorii TaxID=2483200 RepID=A0AAD7XHQ4_9STRA|nr:hypothetical protein CTAYLR_004007 [Chrysophaeum taylorii]
MEDTWSKDEKVAALVRARLRKRPGLAAKVVLSLPPGANALALGLCGATSLVLELGEEFYPHIIDNARQAVLAAGTIPATVVWCLFALRVALVAANRSLDAEFGSPRTASAYAVWGLVFCVALERLRYAGAVESAKLLLYVGAAAQPVVTATFLRAAWKTRARVEPYWSPAVCNAVVVALVGNSVLQCHPVVVISFALSLPAVCLVVPPQLWVIMVRDPGETASAGVAALQAALSAMALTAGNLKRSGFFETCAPSLKFVDDLYLGLVAASFLVFWCTVYSVYKRRGTIFRKFGVDFAAFTFPTCTSAMSALTFSKITSSSDWARLPRRLLRVYAVGLGLAALAITLVVFAGLLFNGLVHTWALVSSEAEAEAADLPDDLECGGDTASAGNTVTLPPRDEEEGRTELPQQNDGRHAKALLALFEDDDGCEGGIPVSAAAAARAEEEEEEEEEEVPSTTTTRTTTTTTRTRTTKVEEEGS